MRAVQRSLAVAALLAAATYLFACGDDPESNNLPPTVELTAGPVDGDSTAWTAIFRWEGEDADGHVDHYEYAIDVPPDQIGMIDQPNPPDISWTETTAMEGIFPFTTPDPDTAWGTGGEPGPPTRWTGMHTFVVRSVDEDGGVSPPDYLAFTALNFAPKTTFNGPLPPLVTIGPGCSTTLSWTTTDPESPAGIAGYDVKYAELPQWLWLPPTFNDLLEFMDSVPWIPVSPDTTEITLGIESGAPWCVMVRARDVNGAIESVFVPGQNLVMLAVSQAMPGTPRLMVRDRIIGEQTFPGPEWTGEIAVSNRLRFEMTGDASSYGGTVTGYKYGVDVDPESDDRGPGWSAWSLSRVTHEISFDTPGLHTVVFKCRGTGGCNSQATTGVLRLSAVELSFDHEMLYVDDFRRNVSQGFTDAQQDQRNRNMLRAAGIPVDDPSQFGQVDTFGPTDGQGDPTLLRLSEIGAYRMLYWDVLGSGLSRNPALASASNCDRTIQAYVDAGGALWVAGQTVFGAFDVASRTRCLSNLDYEYGAGGDGINYSPADFPCAFMQICGGGFLQARGSNVAVNGLVAADPSIRAVQRGFTVLEVDTTVYRTPPIGFTDAMFTPTFVATGGLDTLYIHRAPRTTSGMHRKPNAFRYHDPDPMPDQGPVAIFGFPLFFLQQGSVEGRTGTFHAAKLMIDWFRAEQQRFHDTHPRAVTVNRGSQ